MIKKAFIKKIFLPALTLILICASFLGCGTDNSENEITLKIDLDLDEDIGLLVIDYSLGGDSGSGGVSNADKSMIDKNDTLYYSLDKQFFENAGDGADMAVYFTVITEYNEPNMENIYTKGRSIATNPVKFRAQFGQTYGITITGGIEEGYAVELLSE